MNDINIYIYIFIICIIYNRLLYTDKKNLLAIIICIIIGYFLYLRNEKNIKENINNKINIEKDINNNLKYLTNINNNNNYYYLSKIPKEFKYLLKDDILVNILTNIDFIKKFNKSRYTELLINADKMMKIYIYILLDIYNPKTNLSIFIDIRNNILEILYSIILIIPLRFKYTYGFNPNDELNKSIKLFILRTRKMITIIEKFSKHEKKIKHLEETLYMPYNKIEYLKNIMP
jgi:hypothetical protein